MSEPTLRQLIEQAEADLGRYKHPDVDEVQRRLHEILMAGDLGGIIHDRLENLYERQDMLFIRTSYSVRCCEQTAEFEFPMSVVDADDPILAIKRWSRAKKLRKAEIKLAGARRGVVDAEEELAKAQSAVAELDA